MSLKPKPPEVQYPAMNSTALQLSDFVQAVAKVTIAAVISADGRSQRRTCVECIHFQLGAELCKLANQRPPAKTIAYGCKSFVSEDDIPF